jgi:transcriptional regulator with XRE-family HTH domain
MLKLTERLNGVSPADPSQALALRLRALREEGWAAEAGVTQGHLAHALGVSVPLISSWENTGNPKLPPKNRLDAYATFFATPRSMTGAGGQLLDPAELTDTERERRDRLARELNNLRSAVFAARRATVVEGGLWRFPDDEPVIIVDTELPEDMRTLLPYADPASPDYMELFSYADPDAVIELFGHIRAANPGNGNIQFRTASSMRTPELTNAHLVLLGGVDWNTITKDLLYRLDLPVRQVPRDDDQTEGFEVLNGDTPRRFGPKLASIGDHEVLLEDVAHVYRGPNPYNRRRTVTICNGMFGRGTFGAVRGLTDESRRDGNEAFLRKRFPDLKEFSVLTKVQVVDGKAVTPDWTAPGTVLHVWPEAGA